VTGSPDGRAWPFAIVEAQLIVVPGFLAADGPDETRAVRALVGGARTGGVGEGDAHTAEIDGGAYGPLSLAYRTVPIPGALVGRREQWVRDSATRRLFMIEGLVVRGATAPELDEDAVTALRAQTVPTVRRYLDRRSPRYEPDPSRPLPSAAPPDEEPADGPPAGRTWPPWPLAAGLVALGGVLWEILRTLLRSIVG
jgi:hypothetical protein